MQLRETIAWVTGAGKRLGRLLALELARRGCHVALHYGQSAAEAHEVAQAAERMGRRALVYRADLADVEQIHSMGRRIETEFGRLDILINCAANFDRVPLEEITEESWNRALDVNLRGSAFCALEAARLMRLKRGTGQTLAAPITKVTNIEEQPANEESEYQARRGSARVINLDAPMENTFTADRGDEETEEASFGLNPAPTLWGKIINFADWSALRPYRNYLPYMISKGGIITLTQTLAQELAPEITVNAIAPGTVLPPERTTPAEVEKITTNIPLRRIGSPADIAATMFFLLEGSDYITGQVVCVDGGRFVAQGMGSKFGI